ncbi:hypothetical protein HY945_05550 [Candidatus Gottesmanbacteria bacterium]|nr:hypothetical protein [Candidatus Gottesmanbacteria bacterium]
MDKRRLFLGILVKIFSIFFGIVLFLVSAELALRIFGYKKPAYSTILLPAAHEAEHFGLISNAEGWIDGVHVKLNSKGLRDREYSFKKDSGVFRIFILGRCVVFGHGVESEKAYPKRLELLLNKNNGPQDKRRYEVINGGIPGQGRWPTHVEFFKKEAIKYQPDMLIFQWEIRPSRWDAVRQRQPFWVNFFALNVVSRMPKGLCLTWFLYEKLKFYKWQFYWQEIMKEKDGEINYINERYSESGVEWYEDKRSLEALFSFAQENNISVMVMILPWMNYFNQDHPFQRLYSLVIDICDSYKIKTLNFFDYFKTINPSQLWLGNDDRRPNRYAHEIMAQAIYEKLIKEGFLKHH